MFVFGIDESIPVPLFRACSIPSKVNVVDDAGNVVDTYSNAAKNIDGKINRIDEIEVPFKRNPNHDSAEFTRQLKAQEEGMNNLTVEEYLNNREKYLTEGRALEGNAAQQAARESAYAEKVRELRTNGLNEEAANIKAKEWMNTQAALHNPDQVAGGNPSNIGGMGNKQANSSLGAQWKYRIDVVDEQIKNAAKDMTDLEKANTYLNVKLIE